MRTTESTSEARNRTHDNIIVVFIIITVTIVLSIVTHLEAVRRSYDDVRDYVIE